MHFHIPGEEKYGAIANYEKIYGSHTGLQIMASQWTMSGQNWV